MAWKLAPALETLRNQINAAYPNRSKLSDGTIGDAAHSSRTSDHNPDSNGIVCAMDITHDPINGLTADKLSDVLFASRDRRIAYIIANRLITTPSGTGSGNYGPWTRYNGENPHTKHVHISILHGTYANDVSKWNLPDLGSKKPSIPEKPPTVVPPKPAKIYQGKPIPAIIARGTQNYFGSISGPTESKGGYNVVERPLIKMLQQRLIACGFVPAVTSVYSTWADGIFDTPADRPGQGATSQAVARFQRAHMPNTQYFGQVWWDDWQKLFNL